jgi:hypothetical protein
MGAGNSQYDYILFQTTDFLRINQKIVEPLCKINLCKISPNNKETVICIPKYWSIRSRAVFLNRILGERVKFNDNDFFTPNERVPEPDAKVLEELDRLPTLQPALQSK